MFLKNLLKFHLVILLVGSKGKLVGREVVGDFKKVLGYLEVIQVFKVTEIGPAARGMILLEAVHLLAEVFLRIVVFPEEVVFRVGMVKEVFLVAHLVEASLEVDLEERVLGDHLVEVFLEGFLVDHLVVEDFLADHLAVGVFPADHLVEEDFPE